MRTKRTLRALGALFVAAIAALLVAGCGSGVPSNAVADVAGNPITIQAFNHWMYVAEKGNAAQSPGAPVIVPTDPPEFKGCVKQVRAQIPSLAKTPSKTIVSDCKQLFTSLSSQVLDFLIKAYWYQADAYKQGIRLSSKQLDKLIAQQQKQFPTKTAYSNYIKQIGMTEADVAFRVRVNKLFQELLAKATKKVTPSAIAAYYSSHSSTFGTPESRNIRIVRTNSQAKAQAALAALKSGQSWTKVAKTYSIDLASKNNGGLLTDVTSGEEEAALNKVAFSAPLNKLEGPIHGTFGWYIVDVVKVTKATKQSLKQATPLIKELLSSQYQSAAQTIVNAAGKKNWGGSTKCQSNYMMSDCSGYQAPKTTSTPLTSTGSSGAGAGTVTATPTVTATTTTPKKKK